MILGAAFLLLVVAGFAFMPDGPLWQIVGAALCFEAAGLVIGYGGE